MSYTLADIAKHIGAELHGDEQCNIENIATLRNAQKGQVAFLANSKYQSQLAETQASAVIISPNDLASCKTNALVMKNPYAGFALVAQLLDTTPAPAKAIHKTAVIDDDAVVGENVAIGANSVIEAGVTIEDDVVIGAGCFIGKNARIRQGTKLWSNVSVYHQVEIGQHCLIQANTVIGADGFGYANDQGQWLKIPQLGTVIIGDNVEVGASTTIDRGALENTIIGNGVILDNQIQIAHNAVIGDNTAIAGCSVVAGSTTIGKNCIIGGMVAINGHLNICDGVVLTGMTMVTKAISKPGVYSSGMPSLPNKEWHKMNARVRKLDSLAKRVNMMEKTIDADND